LWLLLWRVMESPDPLGVRLGRAPLPRFRTDDTIEFQPFEIEFDDDAHDGQHLSERCTFDADADHVASLRKYFLSAKVCVSPRRGGLPSLSPPKTAPGGTRRDWQQARGESSGQDGDAPGGTRRDWQQARGESSGQDGDAPGGTRRDWQQARGESSGQDGDASASSGQDAALQHGVWLPAGQQQGWRQLGYDSSGQDAALKSRRHGDWLLPGQQGWRQMGYDSSGQELAPESRRRGDWLPAGQQGWGAMSPDSSGYESSTGTGVRPNAGCTNGGASSPQETENGVTPTARRMLGGWSVNADREAVKVRLSPRHSARGTPRAMKDWTKNADGEVVSPRHGARAMKGWTKTAQAEIVKVSSISNGQRQGHGGYGVVNLLEQNDNGIAREERERPSGCPAPLMPRSPNSLLTHTMFSPEDGLCVGLTQRPIFRRKPMTILHEPSPSERRFLGSSHGTRAVWLSPIETTN
jgi:hypothetical protein